MVVRQVLNQVAESYGGDRVGSCFSTVYCCEVKVVWLGN
jgi:hypothetical protein